MTRHYAAFPAPEVKTLDDEAGTFEAIVSVFNNIDYYGDRIVPGAFAASLERWRASGDPIPVIWSHNWHDLNAYIGGADPKDVEELAPGHPDLPETIRDLGGLRVRAKLDLEDTAGRKALRLLKSRRVREFSFAYDVNQEATGDDGANELHEVDIIEVGPTLKGANPATELIGAKTDRAAKALDELGDIVTRLNDTLLPAGLEVYIRPIKAEEEPPAEEPPAEEPPAEEPPAEEPPAKAADYLNPATLAATLDAELIDIN